MTKSEKPKSDLVALRAELAELDRRLLELVAERQETATRIGRLKQDLGEGTRNYAQEKEVMERGRQISRSLMLSESLADELLSLLIRHSLTRQEQQRVVSHGGGDGRRVLVIGGAGKMGSWFVRFLHSQGFEVEIADPAGPVEGFPHFTDWKEASLDQDLIVVACPIRTASGILRELLQRRPPGLILDIASLKSPLRTELFALADAGLQVCSIHPMFGPDTELLSGRHVIFITLGGAEAHLEVRRLFEPTMAELVEMDLEDHDRLIAYVLGLSHALNIVFFSALAESGEAAPRLARLSSTTFDAQLAVAASVARDNPHLYFEIQSLNDYGSESLSALLSAVESLLSVVRAGDEEGFTALMQKGLEYLATRHSRPPRLQGSARDGGAGAAPAEGIKRT